VIRASAGSGKTHQLTNRYLALLAAGVEPNAILATTFTRKAAGEILNRVLERLALAAADAGQAKELANQLCAPRFAARDFRALLRKMLANLPRVRISTLDSFYVMLAGSVGLELGLPAGWSICEPSDDDALRRDALERLIDRQSDQIGALLPLLSKGDFTRLIQGRLQDVIAAHYEVYQGSESSAWGCLHVPDPVADEERTTCLERLRKFDFTACRDKRFFTARDTDVAKFEEQRWGDFVSAGLAKAILSQKPTYQGKTIPDAARALYETLLQHARSEIIRTLVAQTKATWDLLDRFHGELWSLKQVSGALRFGEVTQALVEALSQKHLSDELLAFRLDGSIEHLLLDEFQDTSLAQWQVLLPMARRIKRSTAGTPRSFFCVGDVKQAIYGWRGGMAEIFNTLQQSLGHLDEFPIAKSRRSAQQIIDAVNQVFGNLAQFQAGDNCEDGVRAWAGRFETHTTAKQGIPGYVCLCSGPAENEGDDLSKQRVRHCQCAADKIRELAQQAPHASIGVLCRKNDTLARIIYELRKRGVEASEEGGNPLTDSAAVELVLSLLTLADHPGHTIAWFHVQNSPLREHLSSNEDADACAAKLRRELMAEGYGPFMQTWAKRIAPACDHRDLARLQQLVEMAFDYQARSTLRADDFVTWVREQRVPDPSSARVRVMSIHSAKGLQFDAVVLPELEAELPGRSPKFIVGRDPKTLAANLVCRYADKSVQSLLTAEEQAAFNQDRQRVVEESLSLLYVAMTRAVYALYLIVPGPRDGKTPREGSWSNLLVQTLAPKAKWDECRTLYEHGDSNWFARIPVREAAPTASLEPQKPIILAPFTTERRRGLEQFAPSRHEGDAKLSLSRLFDAAEGASAAVGTLFHEWFSLIAWLDDGMPSAMALQAAAAKIRTELTVQVWNDREKLMADFLAVLQRERVAAVLQRSAYAGPEQAAFPKRLASSWTRSLAVQHVERERPFLLREGAELWNGRIDRVVWLGENGRTVAADVIDYKTDAIRQGDSAWLAEKVKFYRPQMDAYRQAVARLGQIAPERVAVRLVFTGVGRVEEV
jgi:ATP-dependent exoDNAse (exonuclease V) beta subunit